MRLATSANYFPCLWCDHCSCRWAICAGGDCTCHILVHGSWKSVLCFGATRNQRSRWKVEPSQMWSLWLCRISGGLPLMRVVVNSFWFLCGFVCIWHYQRLFRQLSNAQQCSAMLRMAGLALQVGRLLTRCCSLEVHLSERGDCLCIRFTCTCHCQFCRSEATELHYFRCSVGFLALSSSTTHQQYTSKSISCMHSFSFGVGFGRKQPLPWRNSGDA